MATSASSVHTTMVEAAESTGGTCCNAQEGEHVCYLGPGHQANPRQQQHECSCGEHFG